MVTFSRVLAQTGEVIGCSVIISTSWRRWCRHRLHPGRKRFPRPGRNNLFVYSLEGQDGWFRLHPLLLDTLRQRLETVASSEAIAVFHRRAADWFNARGYVEQAIQHSLAAGDTDRACEAAEARLLSALGSEDLLEVETWLRRLPEQVIRQRPLLLAIHQAGRRAVELGSVFVLVPEACWIKTGQQIEAPVIAEVSSTPLPSHFSAAGQLAGMRRTSSELLRAG
jgi:hypothetical protein